MPYIASEQPIVSPSGFSWQKIQKVLLLTHFLPISPTRRVNSLSLSAPSTAPLPLFSPLIASSPYWL
jgi:hypothetical protein